MIRRFLKGLPYTLTQPMFREYEAKCRDLQQWAEHSNVPRIQRYLQQREQIHFIVAMGIYYRYVVAPFLGLNEFLQRLYGGFGSDLEIGGQKVGESFRDTIAGATGDFRRIAEEFGLPEPFFALTDVRRIVLTLIEIEERRLRE